jgi:hypothetical protein
MGYRVADGCNHPRWRGLGAHRGEPFQMIYFVIDGKTVARPWQLRRRVD